MYTTISSGDLARFGVWTAPFYLSSGFKAVKGMETDEILKLGQEALTSCSQFELDKMYKMVYRKELGGGTFILKTRGEMDGNFTIRDMVSLTTEKRLWSAIKQQSISKCSTRKHERLLVSVLVIWLKEVIRSPKNLEIAIDRKAELVKELADLEEYLKDIK